MASLISDLDKQLIESTFHDVFDTFKRPLVVYLEPERIYATTDPDFSRFGQFGQNNEMQKQDINQQKIYTINACVLYSKNPSFEQFNKDKTGGTYEQIKMREPDLKVRIKVDQVGYDILKDAKFMKLDGVDFVREGPVRPHGLFTPTRWSFTWKIS